MTCTVGVEGEDYLAIASDGFWGHREKKMKTDCEKVFKRTVQTSDGQPLTDDTNFARVPMVFGTCGRPRIKQLLHHQLDLPEHRVDRRSVIEYLTGPFIDSIQDLFENQNILHKEEEVAGVYKSAFLIGYGSGIYEVANNFQVTRAQEGYMAVGAGQYYALGALSALDKDRRLPWNDPDTAASRAIYAAARHSPSIQVPPLYQQVVPKSSDVIGRIHGRREKEG